MSCGCVIEKPARTRTNKRTCPDHPGEVVVERSMLCCDCGQEFKIPVLGGGHKRCPDCREIKNQENTRKTNASKKVERRYQQKVTLVFECGCRIRADKFPGRGNRLCPKHQKRLKHRVSTCVRCGEEFKVPCMTGKVQLLCQDCIDRPITADVPIKKASEAAASYARNNCKHRSDCTMKYFESNCLPCLGCKKYEPEEIRPTQLSKYDPCEWALGEEV